MKDGAEKNARERFGHFLRANGERLFANQADLAHVLDISPAYVSKWYRGDVSAHTPEMLRRWAHALQVPISDVLMEAGYLTTGDCAQIVAESATPPPDDPVQIIEQIAALTDRLDRVMRADRESRARRQNAAS
jgi:transcriptional regulator with XRE-family HTH domain